MSARSKIAVLGGGAWGTALAVTMLRAGHSSIQWARDAATVEAINDRRENPRYLPGVTLDEGLAATGDLETALSGAACVLSVVPAQVTRSVLHEIAPLMDKGTPLVLCAKGIERDSGMFLSQIVAELVPAARAAALSGPSFATDVARGLPTAVTVAATDDDEAATLAALLSSPSFRFTYAGPMYAPCAPRPPRVASSSSR